MRKVVFILFNLLTITAMAQTKGRFEVHDLENFKLHVYYINDALGDASYIVEGENGLVTMEQPLFKDTVTEFDAYIAKLGKPVAQRITACMERTGSTTLPRLCSPANKPSANISQIKDGKHHNCSLIRFGCFPSSVCQ